MKKKKKNNTMLSDVWISPVAPLGKHTTNNEE